MPLKTIEMDDLIEILDRDWPDLEWEIDRHWVWLLTDLAPVHRNKCACEECSKRAAIRKAIGREGLGFIFAPNGHVCPSGAESKWGNHAMTPTRFKRRSSKKTGDSAETETNPQPSETVSDAELLAIIGG